MRLQIQASKEPLMTPNIQNLIQVKYLYDESGLCRKYYRSTEGHLMCLQGDHAAATWYFCSRDGEPSHPINEQNTYVQILED